MHSVPGKGKRVSQRILVVDDDRSIVRLVRAYLEQAGFEVLVAYDGETALHAMRRDRRIRNRPIPLGVPGVPIQWVRVRARSNHLCSRR